ncbi:MAG: glycosyltransferase, partial [Candidatus Dormibacteria bacterium]
MLDSPVRAVAVISYHTSPLGSLGRGENGGMNLAIRRLCEGLSAAGVPTDVFVRRDDAAAASEELIAPRSRLIRIPAGPERPIPKTEARHHVGTFVQAVIDHALSERRRYRLIHAHYWLGGLVAGALQRAWAVPWVQSFHTLAGAKLAAGLDVEDGRAAREGELAAAADLLLAASHAEAGDLVRLYGVPPSRVSVIPPGVAVAPPADAGRLAELRGRLGLEGCRVVLFAGRLEPLKGIDLLLEAMTRLAADEEFSDVHCVV